ncbi:MAG TPA: hypothetical protein VE913_06040 [Longimicrobium sp.]|nr:hypothetical protein [Longimicrobium sp.]
MSVPEPEIRALSQALFGMAKWASRLALTSEVVALVFSARLAIARAPEWTSVPLLALLALVTFLFRGLADAWRDQADEQLRKLDLADGLGRPISARDCADLMANAPRLAVWLSRRRPAESYFASASTGSPRRLVENLRESAWWTWHLGRTAEWLQKVWLIVFGTFGVGTLAMQAIRPGGFSGGFLTKPSLAVALLLFLFTSGPYGRLGKFRSLHEAAHDVEMKAGHLLDHPERIDESKALLLAGDYHLARKGAPLLSSLVWRLRKAELNRLWGGVARGPADPMGA